MTFIVSSPAARPAFVSASIAAAFAAMADQAQERPDRNTERVLVMAPCSPWIASEALSDNIVITPKDIARSGQTSLAVLPQRQCGIEAARNGGPGAHASMFIRSIDSCQNIVLVDDARYGMR